jgi:hypothetical protein
MEPAARSVRATAASRPVSDRTVRWLAPLVLTLLVFAVYAPVRHHGFINYDDPLYVSRNPMVKSGLTWMGVRWAFQTMPLDNYFPLTLLSHMLDCQLFDIEPGPHHVVNVLFHAANAVILYFLLLRMTGAFWPSAIVAALFALHPVQVGTVAWIAERKNVLSTLFWLLTIRAYAGYVEGSRRGAGGRQYALALLFFVLGLLSKPMLVSVPLCLLLLDVWPLGRVRLDRTGLAPAVLWRLVREKLPFVAITVAFVVVTIRAQENTIIPLRQLPIGYRVENALISYVRYVGKVLWPTGFAIFYERPDEWPLWQVLGSALVLVVVTAAALRLAPHCPPLLVGWLWFLVTLIPVIGLVQVGAHAMADRYMYVPIIGLLVAIVWGLRALAGRWQVPTAVLGGAVALAVSLCLVLTWINIAPWRSMEALLGVE